MTLKSGSGSVLAKASNRSGGLPLGIAAALQAPNSQPIVQVVTDDARCFEAVMTSGRVSTLRQFVAKAP